MYLVAMSYSIQLTHLSALLLEIPTAKDIWG
nr:MAG TPA: hypothetical protein [Caudoviricetes sp.]